MPQSYTNPSGSGDRVTRIGISTTAVWGGGGPFDTVDGTLNDTAWLDGGQNGRTITYDFLEPRIVTGAKWYQDAAGSQGTWRWRGSNDKTTWTNIGGTFTLGSSATQTITTLSANTTAYRYYQLQQTAGSTNISPYVRQIEFNIDDGLADPGYGAAESSGNRAAIISVLSNCLANSTVALPLTTLVDGKPDKQAYMTTGLTSDGLTPYIEFVFNAPVCLVEAALMQSVAGTQGIWQWKARNGVTYDNIGAPFTLGNATITGANYLSDPTQHQILDTLSANILKYARYRIEQVSGARNISPWFNEMLFKVKTQGAIAPGGGRRRQAFAPS